MNFIRNLLFVTSLVVIALPGASRGAMTYSGSAVTSFTEITIPPSMTTVVKAVNVGSTFASVVNDITFAADSGNWPADNGEGDFTGNGYTAHGFTEGAGGLAGASFTTTTINFGSTGYMLGDTFTGLTLNTDYIFQLYLSDFHANRGAQFTYALGADTDVQDISQTFGNTNRYQVAFNSGADTTFAWQLDPVPGFHDGKVAGYAFFSAAAVPEPAATAAMLAVLVMGLVAGRRWVKKGARQSAG